MSIRRVLSMLLAVCMIVGMVPANAFAAETGGQSSVQSAVMTHEEYMAAELDSQVTVEFYVQATESWWNETITVYGQNVDGGYLAYNMSCSEADAAKLTPGTKIRVTGTKTVWSGEVEITEASFVFVEADPWIAEPVDLTALLGTEELNEHQNEKVCFSGLTVQSVAYQNGEPGRDIYVSTYYDNGSGDTVQTLEILVEQYLTDPASEVYQAVQKWGKGAVVSVQGYLRWYNGPTLYITDIISEEQAEYDYSTLKMDEPQMADITEPGGYAYFAFTPSVSCTYIFYSETDEDTYGHLYDADMNELDRDDDAGGERNFCVAYDLVAGTTYILGARFLNEHTTGSFPVTVTHSRGVWSTTEWIQMLTCTQDGIERYSCNCGYFWDSVYPAAHTWVQTEYREATCTEPGYRVNTCQRCGEIDSEEFGPWEHSYDDVEHVQATCEEDGYIRYACYRCGDSYTTTLEATGHDYNYGRCRVCGKSHELSGELPGGFAWSLSGSDRVLRISGTGALPQILDYENPWVDQKYWIEGVVLSEGITEIYDYTFGSYYQLRSVSLPSTLTKIGDHAFEYDDKLEYIALPAGLQTIGARAFQYTGLREIIIPGSVTEIGESAFYTCQNLTSVILREGIQEIGYGAFEYCHALTEVSLPDSLRIIGNSAFDGAALESVNLPGNLQEIRNCAFASTKLVSVTIPASVEYLDRHAFANCAELTSVTVEEGNQVYTSRNGVVYAFEGQTLYLIPGALQTMTVPADVRYVDAEVPALMQTMVFEGNAPTTWEGQFSAPDRLTVYYPADNKTWIGYYLNYSGWEIHFEPLPELAILVSPQDITVNEGDPVRMSVQTLGATEHTWQRLDQKTGQWIDQVNDDQWEFVAAFEETGDIFRCAVTNGTETIYTEQFSLTVRPVFEAETLGQEETMLILAGSYGIVRFTADYTGMYMVRWNFETWNHAVQMETNLPDEQIYSNWVPLTLVFVEEGKEYEFYLENSAYSAGGAAWVTVSVDKPVTLTEGQQVDVQASTNHEAVLQFTPESSDWYQLIGFGTGSLEDKDHAAPNYDYNDDFWWLDAGVTYYYRVGGQHEEMKTYPALVGKRVELQTGDTVTGAFAWYGTSRVVYVTPAETGFYRLAMNDVYGINVDLYTDYASSNFVNQYHQLEGGQTYRIRFNSETDDYVTYTATLEQMPKAEVGYTEVMDLKHGQSHHVVFTPDTTDFYIFTATAPDGTLLDVYIDNSGSYYWAPMTGGRTYRVEFNNQSGVDYTDVTLSIRRQSVLEENVPAVMEIGLNFGSMSFYPQEAGLYCFEGDCSLSVTGAYSHYDDVASANAKAIQVGYKEFDGRRCRVWYYLEAGQHYYVSTNTEEAFTQCNLKVNQVPVTALGQEVPVVLEQEEPALILFEITESGRYMWSRPSDEEYGSEYWEVVVRFEEDRVDSYHPSIHGTENGGIYHTMEMEPGLYALVMWNHDRAVNRVVTIEACPAPDEIWMSERYSLEVGQTVDLFVNMNPSELVSLSHVTWTVGDPSIIEVLGTLHDSVRLRTLAAGTTTLTGTLPNGNSCTAIISVKEPIQAELNQSVEVTLSAHDNQTLVFHPQETGYYVIAGSADGAWYANGYHGFMARRIVNNVDYTYVYWEAGQEYPYVVNAPSETVTVTVEARKAETPTELHVTDCVDVFAGRNVTVELYFGSPWEFAPVEWYNEHLSVVYNGHLTVEVYCPYPITTVLTATCGSLRGGCTFNVLDAIPLALDQYVSVDMSAGGDARLCFTPNETGMYLFDLGDDLSVNMVDAFDNWVSHRYSGQTCMAWLVAGNVYTLELHNMQEWDRNLQVLVSAPQSLPYNEEINFVVRTDSMAIHSFRPETSGYYTVWAPRLPEVSVEVLHNGDVMQTHRFFENEYEHYTVWLDAGETYHIMTQNGFEAQWCRLRIAATPAPESMELELWNTTVVVGETANMNVRFTPGYAVAEFQVYIEDPTVLALEGQMGIGCTFIGCTFIGLKPGTTNVTFVSGDLQKTATFTVVEPMAVSLDQPVSAVVSGESGLYYTLEIPEAGFYIINLSSDRVTASMLRSSANYGGYGALYQDGQSYHRYWLEAGTYVFHTEQYSDSGEPLQDLPVNLLIRKAEEPTALILPETLTGYVGSWININLDFGSPWAFTPVSWSLENNNDVVYWDYEPSHDGGTLVGRIPGTATVTVRGMYNDLSASCEITVEELSLTMGQELPIYVENGGSSVMVKFTPTESGFYFFPLDGVVDINVVHAADNDPVNGRDSNNGSVYYLEANRNYMLAYFTYSGMNANFTARVEYPAVLNQEEPGNISMNGNEAAFFTVTAEETDWYILMTSQFNLGIQVYDTNWNEVGFSNDVARVRMNAGETYLVVVRSWTGSYVHSTVTFGKCPAPESIELGGKGNAESVVAVGGNLFLSAYLQPYYALTELTWTVDEDLLIIDEIYPEGINLIGKAAGVTTVTVTTSNGLSASVEVTVVEPVYLEQNESVQATVSRQQPVYLAFTAPESGVYAVRSEMQGMSLSVEGDAYIHDFVEENGEQYRYIYIEEGRTAMFVLRCHDESSRSATVELRKTTEPTVLDLPHTVSGFVDSSVRIPLRYDSFWTYPMGELSYHVEGDAVEAYIETGYSLRAYLQSIGTATVTVTYRHGDVVLSDICEITVTAVPAMVEDQIMEFTIPANGSVRTTFVPSVSGYYVFRGSPNLDMGIMNADMALIIQNGCNAYYLEANRTYEVYAENYEGHERTIALQIKQVQRVSMEQRAATYLPSGWADVVVFTPETSGNYVFCVDSPFARFRIYDMGGNHVENNWGEDGQRTYMSAYLTEGVTYFVMPYLYEGDPAYEGDIYVQPPMAPDKIQIYGRELMQVGAWDEFYVEFYPTSSAQNFTITIEDPSVVRVVSQGIQSFTLEGRKAGSTWITVSVGDIYAEYYVTVVEPIRETLIPGKPVTMTLQPNSIILLDCSVNGNYVLSFEHMGMSIVNGPIDGVGRKDGMAYVFSRGLFEGLDYPYTLEYHGEESAVVTFLLQEEAPLENAYLSQTQATMEVGDRLILELMREPVTAWTRVEEWKISDETILYADVYAVGNARFVAMRPGKATVTAVLDNGTELTCEITVMPPTLDGELTLGVYAEHIMLDHGDFAYYSFTAPETDRYFIANIAYFDAFLEIYDDQWNRLDFSNDYGDTVNSGLWIDLEKGQQIFVHARLLGEEGIVVLKTVVSTTDDVYGITDRLELSFNEPVQIRIWDGFFIEFTPETTGWYKFCMEGMADYVLSVRKGEEYIGDYWFTAWDSPVFHLNADETYTVIVAQTAMVSEVITFWVEEAVVVSELEIITPPERDTFVYGNVYGFAEYNLEGLVMKLTWSDGTVTEHSVDDDGHYINNEPIGFEVVEHENGTGTVTLSVGDGSDTYTISLVENPVVKVEIDDSEAKPWVEGAGLLDYDGHVSYSKHPLLKDLKFKVTFNDGRTETFRYEDEIFCGYTMLFHDDWCIEGLGGTNEITFHFLGVDAERYSFEFVESPVAKLEIVSQPKVLTVGKDDRIFVEDGKIHFRHDWDAGFDGMVIRITYTDGSVEEVTYDQMTYPDRGDKFFRFPEWNGYGMEAQIYMPERGYEFAYWTMSSYAVPDSGEVPMILHYMGKYAYFTVKVSDKIPVTITEDPADVTVYEGEKAVFTVAATGDGLTYQWQYRTGATGQWIDLDEHHAELTVIAALAQNGFEYRCVVTDAAGDTAESKAAKLTVKQKLNITGQPANATVYEGEEAVFSVTAVGEGLSYQWQYRANAKAQWTNMSVKTAKLTVAATLAENGYEYQCVVTDAEGNTMTSAIAKLTVKQKLNIVTQPANQTVAEGETAIFTVEAVGEGLKYQWQYRPNAKTAWENHVSNTNALYIEASSTVNGYEYRCVITDADGNSMTSAVAKLTCVATPKITKLENTADGIKITWGKVDGAVKYRVYVKKGTGWSKISDVSGTSLVYTEAVSGESYTFTVRALDGSGKFCSSYNNTGWSKVYVAQPEITKLENTASGIKITWGKVAGAAKYRVYVKSGSSWKVLSNTASTSYTFKDVEGGESYTFTVRCMDAEGTMVSAYNTTGWSKVYVAQPAISKLESTADGIKLSWNAVAGAEKYRIYIKSGTSWKALDAVTGTSYTYADVKAGTTYAFTIRCVDADNKVATSAYNTTGWSHKYYPTPAIAKLESTTSGVKITWNAVDGAAKYRVYVKNANGGWTKLTDTTDTSYTWSGGQLNTSYTFTIRCLASDGKTYVSNYNTSGWSHKYYPTPSITDMESTAKGVTITWTPVSGAAKYRVYVKSGNGWKALGAVTGTSYTYTGGKPGTTYTFTIRCVDANNKTTTSNYNTSGWSHKYYPMPTISKMESTTDGVKITWGKIAGAEKYRIYVKSGSSWKSLGAVSGTSYTWTGAKAGTTYTFTIRCVNADNTKATSNYNTTGWSHKYYPTPEITKLESAANGVKITWDAINGTAKYRVYVKSGSSWKKITDTTATSYTWTGAEKGQTYIFTVRCLASDGKTYVSTYNTSGWSYTYN